MTELEILAQLKIAYLNIDDIIDNADEYAQKISADNLYKTIDILNTEYKKVYENMKEKFNNLLYYKKYLKIGDSIYRDYILEFEETEEPMSYKDIENEDKWWEDYNFLTNFYGV